jgi:hypothetical protein
MRQRPVSRPVLAAGWTITAVITLSSALFIAQPLTRRL